MQEISLKPARRVITSERRNSPLALAIFLIAYAGIMFVIFAPKGTFVSQPYSVSASEGR